MLGFQQLKLINDIQRYIKNLSFTIYILIAVFVIGKIFFIYLEPDLLPRFYQHAKPFQASRLDPVGLVCCTVQLLATSASPFRNHTTIGPLLARDTPSSGPPIIGEQQYDVMCLLICKF